MNTELYQRSVENKIKEGYQKLANIEATKTWANQERNTYLPKFEKPKVKKFNAGIFNFLRVLLP
jgi:hypothetical protein